MFVNNAVARPMKGYDDLMENFAKSMEINATGVMDILRDGFFDRTGRGGSIINIASMMECLAPICQIIRYQYG